MFAVFYGIYGNTDLVSRCCIILISEKSEPLMLNPIWKKAY